MPQCRAWRGSPRPSLRGRVCRGKVYRLWSAGPPHDRRPRRWVCGSTAVGVRVDGGGWMQSGGVVLSEPTCPDRGVCCSLRSHYACTAHCCSSSRAAHSLQPKQRYRRARQSAQRHFARSSCGGGLFRGTHSMWKERRHGPAEGMPHVRRGGGEGGGGGATAAVSGLERTVAADQLAHLLAEGAHVL